MSAIQTGKNTDRGIESQKAFPFIYPFVSIQEAPLSGSSQYSNTSHMAVAVPANQSRLLPIRMEPDLIFIARSIKYSVMHKFTRTLLNLAGTASIDPGTTDTLTGAGTAFLTELRANDVITIAGQKLVIANVIDDVTAILFSAGQAVAVGSAVVRLARVEYQTYEDQDLGAVPPASGFFLEQFAPQMRIGTPLSHFVRVAFVATSPSGEFIYGDRDLNPLTFGIANRVLLDCIQGLDYGPGELYTPHMFPPSGIMGVEIQNIHPTKELLVGGAILGIKVRG
jgi:hypothetical protein